MVQDCKGDRIPEQVDVTAVNDLALMRAIAMLQLFVEEVQLTALWLVDVAASTPISIGVR